MEISKIQTGTNSTVISLSDKSFLQFRPKKSGPLSQPGKTLVYLLKGMLFSFGLHSMAPADTTVIAHRTDPAIGDDEFSGFGGPVLNNASQVSFAATIGTAPTGEDTALFRGTKDMLTMFAREGSRVSGFPRVYNDFRELGHVTEPAINDAGRVAWWARSTSQTDPSGNDVEHVMWWDHGTLVRTVAFTNHGPPDGNGAYESFGRRVGLAEFGGLIFRAAINVADPFQSGSQGIFLNDGLVPSATFRLVRAGDTEYHGVGPIVMCGLNTPCGIHFGYNDYGQIGTFALVEPPDGRSLMLRSFAGGQPFIVGSELGNWDFSGLAMGGVSFEPSVNNQFEVAFSARVRNGSFSTSPTVVLRKRNDTSLGAIQVALTDDPAPDGNGVLAQMSRPIINDSSQVAFASTFWQTMDAPNDDSGIMLSTADVPAIVAREGDVAIGGGLYSELGNPVFALNQSGMVAFQAEMHGLPVQQRGIFLSDAEEFEEVVRTGSLMLGSTIADVEFVGDSARQRTGLNDLGQVAYRAVLENGLEAIAVYTPDARWRPGTVGSWDTPDNWKFDIKPAQVHHVIVDSPSPVVVSGPAGSASVRSLVVGPGSVELALATDSQIQCDEQFELSGDAALILDVDDSSPLAPSRIETVGDAHLSGVIRIAPTGEFIPLPAHVFEVVFSESGTITGQLNPEPDAFPFVVQYEQSAMRVVVLPRAGDLSTIGPFSACLGGAQESPNPVQPFIAVGCLTAFDSDDDGDVDLLDYSDLQNFLDRS